MLKWLLIILLVVVVFKLWQKIARFRSLHRAYLQMIEKMAAKAKQSGGFKQTKEQTQQLVACAYCGLLHTPASSVLQPKPQGVIYYCSEQHRQLSRTKLDS